MSRVFLNLQPIRITHATGMGPRFRQTIKNRHTVEPYEPLLIESIHTQDPFELDVSILNPPTHIVTKYLKTVIKFRFLDDLQTSFEGEITSTDDQPNFIELQSKDIQNTLYPGVI